MRKTSTHKRVLNFLKMGYPITGKLAWETFGLYRLSVVINRLRNEGYKIKTKMVTEDGSTFAQYRMKRHD